MKKDPGLTFRLFLMLGDAVAIVLALFLAYLIRTQLDSRPYYFTDRPLDFLWTMVMLIPIWWIILGLLGLYSQKIVLKQSRVFEITHLAAAACLGIMLLITYDFFMPVEIFPVRLVAVYSLLLCFVSLTLMRTLIRQARSLIMTNTDRATLGVIIIGNSKNTTRLIEHLSSAPEEGYRIHAIIAKKQFVPKKYQALRRASLRDALAQDSADVIFQTDEAQTEYVYRQSVKYHLLYYFVPSEAALSSHIGELEVIGGMPAISVRVTPLIGYSRVVKRVMDIIIGGLILLLALIPMGIIWLMVKFSDFSTPAIYSEYRLSRYNQKVRIYKFRSMKPEFSGMSPEAAFKKMGRADLIEKYRAGGDFIPDDPRITRLGRVLRATSLDELPQLFNVMRGDISLVGPRALVPGELRDYGDRSLLLSVKSGLTGLAQVSGRRDISFEERRALDLFYVQNWSVHLDLTILLRTVVVVLTRKGAK